MSKKDPKDSSLQDEYFEATQHTAGDLFTVAKSIRIEDLSELDLPEIEALANEIARVVPAGNVPGLILSSLAAMGSRHIDQEESGRHIEILFRGVRQSLSKAVHGAIFGGPASVLYGYQQLLRLGGIKPEEAFREGTWQFYLEFALREDTARHANETTGFHTYLMEKRLSLSEEDQLAAWLLAVSSIVKQIEAILENEWRERMVLKVMADVVEEAKLKRTDYRNLYKSWEKQRPYHNGNVEHGGLFFEYRRQEFNRFLQPYYDLLKRNIQKTYEERFKLLEQEVLPAYVKQMTWLAYLEPGQYREVRTHYDLSQATIGVIHQGRYYFVNLLEVSDMEAAREVASAILSNRGGNPANLDDALVRVSRANHPALRKRLNAGIRKELEAFRYAPVLINWDKNVASRRPLAIIRQEKRGVGDHPLTLFRTDDSMVFDQSHIFFDGVWGAAIAQIMTNEATDWARKVAQAPAPQSSAKRTFNNPNLRVSKKVLDELSQYEIPMEISAENTSIKLKNVVRLRTILKQRSDLAQVTVNDLFILYRGLHAQRYKPSPKLEGMLQLLQADKKPKSQRAYEVISQSIASVQNKNPAILIPIDASQFNPRDRVFPTTFRNPIADLPNYHNNALKALRAYEVAPDDDKEQAYAVLHRERAVYLRILGGFGQILTRYKEIALLGQSTSNATIKILANLPDSLRKVLDTIPGRFDMLNEVIKGEEVFSNTGRVVSGSSLRRFITAKDDNQQKKLSWGVITDDNNTVHLSLRDFRPYVGVLHELGMDHLSTLVVEDYLESFAKGFNYFIVELAEIMVASQAITSK